MIQNDLTKELSTNFIEYAVAVNTDRAIPDAKSGLKPVAKRILWSAFEEGLTLRRQELSVTLWDDTILTVIVQSTEQWLDYLNHGLCVTLL